MYVLGKFPGTATFGDTTITSVGMENIYLAKYDSTGDFQWVWQSEAKARWDKNRSIATDENNNIYLGGYFSNTKTFGNTTLSTKGDFDIFVTKFDENGNILWTKQAGGTGNDRSYAITTDSDNNVYISGYFNDTAYFLRLYNDGFSTIEKIIVF